MTTKKKKLTNKALLLRVAKKLAETQPNMAIAKLSRYSYGIVDMSDSHPMALQINGTLMTIEDDDGRTIPVVRLFHDLESYAREIGALADHEEAPKARCLGPCAGRCKRMPVPRVDVTVAAN